MRLFVAIELDGRVRSALAEAQRALKPESDGVRWVDPQQAHMTVKFLGEVSDDRVEEAAEAMTEAAAATASFDLEVAGCGCFPPRGPVRIVWAGVTEASGTLVRCAGRIEERFAEMGFPKEQRPYSPHITLGRVRQDRSAGRLRAAVEVQRLGPVAQSVSSLTLMSSTLSPKGALYTPVAKSTLG